MHSFINHAETELEQAKFNILGWWKATMIDDAALVVPKGHIVDMIPTSYYEMKKFIVPQPDDQNANQQQEQSDDSN